MPWVAPVYHCFLVSLLGCSLLDYQSPTGLCRHCLTSRLQKPHLSWALFNVSTIKKAPLVHAGNFFTEGPHYPHKHQPLLSPLACQRRTRYPLNNETPEEWAHAIYSQVNHLRWIGHMSALRDETLTTDWTPEEQATCCTWLGQLPQMDGTRL